MPEIVILATQASFHHAEALVRHFGDRAVMEGDCNPEVVAAHHPALVVAFEVSDPQRGLVMAEMMRRNIATLLVADGILEWRNTWNRTSGEQKRPLNQPATVHKIACLGRLDARVLESWGNLGKCEIVGAPRLDRLVENRVSARTTPVSGRALRLLVMTARSPGFTPQEIEITVQSLQDLRDALEEIKDIEVVWRLSKGLHTQLGVKNTFESASGEELHELLPRMDAVITTPSTAQLEAMLFGLPVALLNYHPVPVYAPAAWEIKCREHIAPVLGELAAPPLERAIYQDFCLEDALACRGTAITRLVVLIEEMIRIKREHDLRGSRELVFPERILNAAEQLIGWPSENFNLAPLYPEHAAFKRNDLVELQSELDAALIANAQLHKQVSTLTQRLYSIPGYKFVSSLVLAIQRKFHLAGHYKV